jgi:hypothetical protein
MIITVFIVASNFKREVGLSKEQIINIYKENKNSFIKIMEDEEQDSSNEVNEKNQYNKLIKQAKIIRIDSNSDEGEIWFIMQEEKQEKELRTLKQTFNLKSTQVWEYANVLKQIGFIT